MFRRGRIPLGRAAVLPVWQKVLVLQLPRAADGRGRRGLGGRRRAGAVGRRRSTVQADLGPGRLQSSAGCRRRRLDDGRRRHGGVVVVVGDGARLQESGRRLLRLARIQNGAVDVAPENRRRRAAERSRHDAHSLTHTPPDNQRIERRRSQNARRRSRLTIRTTTSGQRSGVRRPGVQLASDPSDVLSTLVRSAADADAGQPRCSPQ